MADSATNGESIAEKYNLLPKVMPHLDRHLIFPIIQFQDEHELAEHNYLTNMKLNLLRSTNMVDYIAQLESELPGATQNDAQANAKREEVLDTKAKLDEETERIRTLLEDPEVTGSLRSDKVANQNYLKENHGVQPEDISRLYDLGQFYYSIGEYGGAAQRNNNSTPRTPDTLNHCYF